MADLSLTGLSWKWQLAVFAGLSLAGLGAFSSCYEMPAQERIAARERELATMRARISKGLATARRLPELRKDVADLEARLDSVKPILPEAKDAADLLRRVNTLATQSNLTVQAFRPQTILTRQLHAEWPITLELQGTYHNLGVFLDRISKFPRIINVGALDIRSRAQPATNATIDVTCTVTTFVLLETPAVAPPANKGGTEARKKTQ